MFRTVQSACSSMLAMPQRSKWVTAGPGASASRRNTRPTPRARHGPTGGEPRRADRAAPVPANPVPATPLAGARPRRRRAARRPASGPSGPAGPRRRRPPARRHGCGPRPRQDRLARRARRRSARRLVPVAHACEPRARARRHRGRSGSAVLLQPTVDDATVIGMPRPAVARATGGPPGRGLFVVDGEATPLQVLDDRTCDTETSAVPTEGAADRATGAA